MSRIDLKVEWTLFFDSLMSHACTYKKLWSYNFLRPKKLKNLNFVFLLNPDKDFFVMCASSKAPNWLFGIIFKQNCYE